MKKINYKRICIEIIYIIIGTLFMSVSTSFFLLPNQLSTGGFVGIGTITYYLFQFPISAVILILNIPLFIIAAIKIGKWFFVKSLLGTGLLSIFIEIMTKYQPATHDKLLACIYGGVLTGIGLAFIFKAYASTGGTDLLTRIIHKYKPEFNTSELVVIIDAIIIAISVIVFKDVEIALYAGIAIFIMGKVIDIVFEGVNFTKMMYIISEKSEEIGIKINLEADRGATGIYGKGIYQNEDLLIILCVVGKRQVPVIEDIVKTEDPNAFIIISDSRKVLGNGFQ